MVEVFDHGELVEIADNDFAVVGAQFDAIKPEFLVEAVREPGAGFLLSDPQDLSLDG